MLSVYVSISPCERMLNKVIRCGLLFQYLIIVQYDMCNH